MKQSVPMPSEEWREQFKRSTVQCGWQLNLSRAQLQFICAVADDVHWDRFLHSFNGIPDNFITTSAALERRGLIVRKSQEEIRAMGNKPGDVYNLMDGGAYRLTPPGEKVVDLLKMAGLFVEQEAATIKKLRKRA